MILKREALPVRLHVRGVHTDYVTVSEDSQPMHPGVSQNVGCTRLFFPSSLPPLRSALITLSLSLLQHYCTNQLRRGWMLDDMNHVNMRQGGVAAGVRAHTRTLSYCTLLSMTLPHILSHTHSHTELCTCRPPVVALATLRQIQTFPLKAEPKPTTIVCCWILGGAFPSCQFVQVGIKKTSWPT